MLITVKSSELKRVLEDVSYLKEETLQFGVADNKLAIRVGTKLSYEANIDIISSDEYTETEVNIKYINISAILGSKGEVELTFIATGVILKYGTLSVTFSMSSEILINNDADIPELKPFSDRLLFLSALNLFKKVGIFQKTLSLERPLQLMGDIALMQFPTVWFRAKSSDISAIVTKEQANIILKFEPTHYALDSRLILSNDRAQLILPIMSAPVQDEFLDALSELKSLCKLTTAGVLNRIKVLHSVFGNSHCTVSITAKDFYFTVVNQYFTITDIVDDDILFTFGTRLEYLVALMSLFPDEYVEVLVDDGRICLRDSSLACLLSIGGRNVF